MNLTVTTSEEQQSTGRSVLEGLRSLMRTTVYTAGYTGTSEETPSRRTPATGSGPICEDCQIPLSAADLLLWPNLRICSDCRLRRQLAQRPNTFRASCSYYGYSRN